MYIYFFDNLLDHQSKSNINNTSTGSVSTETDSLLLQGKKMNNKFKKNIVSPFYEKNQIEIYIFILYYFNFLFLFLIYIYIYIIIIIIIIS